MNHAPDRRRLLRQSASLTVGLALPVLCTPANASMPGARRLSMVHTHTLEQLDLVYAVGDTYDPAALRAVNHFLRDHYSGEVGSIDPQLLDVLHRTRLELHDQRPFEVISGYRCPATNAWLRRSRGGGVAPTSLHLQGRAIDIRLPGVALTDLRDAAKSLQRGGIGYYAVESFVHVDTGRVRYW